LITDPSVWWGLNAKECKHMSVRGKLAGKKALVTGSGTGIGREIALEFARQGADVVLHYAHSAAGAESAVREIQALGRKTTAFPADLRALDQVLRLGEQAINFLGGLDCLVNNAGITFNKAFFKVTPEQFDAVFNVNFRAQYFLTQKAAEHMVAHGGGTVCNLTSIHGLSGARDHSVYAATKGAIIACTRTLAVELAHQGVRVNAIAPGWVNVENYFKAIPGFNLDDAAKAAYKSVPVARAGTPLDIAKLAAFLCSDESGFIVGQTITADGGTTALMSLMSDFRKESSATFGKGYVPGIS
jgi:NAD(P)-dependent dehydrogenase (short-subunit alcohol dehydrogenase family)